MHRPYFAIVRQSNDLSPEGSYTFNYETENGISAGETGHLQGLGPKGEYVMTVEGSYQYTSPDGTPIVTKYRAGPEGFIAEGAHLPVAPPIPEAILRSIAYNEAHPEEYNKEGYYKPEKPLYVPAALPTTTYRPYEVDYSTTAKPYYTSPPNYFGQPGYPQRPVYPSTYTPKPFLPKTYVPVV